MKFFLTYVLIAVACLLNAQVPDRPNPPRLVNNFSKEFPDFISSSEQQTLETELQNFSNQTSNQICIVIVDDLGGTDPASYATEIINKWGVGQSDLKNGIVILVKPTGGKGQRNLFIAVGYGLEGAIPDLATKQIREREIEPYFAEGRFYEGLESGCKALMKAAKGEYNVKKGTSGKPNDWIRIVAIIIFIIIFLIIKSKRGGGFGGPGVMFLGGSSFGGSSSFGGGGSSFGGFGGGSSGGGGSGGNW